MFDESVDVLVFPTVRERGRDIPDYTQEPTAAPIRGVDIQPGASTELLAEHREGTEVRYTVFVPVHRVPTGVVLSAGSVVRVYGDVFEVDGRPLQWRGSSLAHYVLFLVDWSAS